MQTMKRTRPDKRLREARTRRRTCSSPLSSLNIVYGQLCTRTRHHTAGHEREEERIPRAADRRTCSASRTLQGARPAASSLDALGTSTSSSTPSTAIINAKQNAVVAADATHGPHVKSSSADSCSSKCAQVHCNSLGGVKPGQLDSARCSRTCRSQRASPVTAFRNLYDRNLRPTSTREQTRTILAAVACVQGLKSTRVTTSFATSNRTRHARCRLSSARDRTSTSRKC
ncbi:hypothetical protein EXIGLDRAFT_31003 [Exidia glandulosa HHB12029]|uniref:Uncharacterized protein n=1 Tax=Exidia glandulosa HHB12029 TaxID=1314781 RepID=A0A165IVY6_EXIGL|nr:hypothetical protein EXIGLDRAFT_31003 [Exidia glandulosa HHB12029]